MNQLKQTKLTPKMVFNNQKGFSEKLHRRTLKAIKDVSESCDKFEIKNQDDTFLFTQVNHYYWELSHIIFNLQQILIDIGKNTSSAYNLEKVLSELNMLTSSIQQSLELEPERLKIKLKEIVVKVGCQLEMLMKIITLDDLFEQKQRMLDCQLDVVICTEKLKMNMDFHNVNFLELERCLHDLTNNLISTIKKIETDYEGMEEDFSHYVHINTLHMQYIVDYMHQLRNAGRFKGNLNGIFKNVEEFGKMFVHGIVDAVEYGNPVQRLLVYLENCHDHLTTSTSELKKGLCEVGEQHFNLQELISYMVVYGLNIFNSLNETIKDVIVKK